MKLPRSVSALALTVLVFGAWQFIVVVGNVSPIILPKASAVCWVLFMKAPLFLRQGLYTLTEVLIGFGIATFAGTALGALISSSRLGGAVYPILVATQVMPKVAIAPILIIWFGFGMTPKIALTVLIAFFPIVINTVVGLNQTPRESIYLFRSMGASRLQTFFRLRLPAALPVLFGGLKVASTLAVVGAIVGEFSGADRGLGYLLTTQMGTSDTAAAFASVLCLTLLGLLTFGFIALIERLLVPSHMLSKLT